MKTETRRAYDLTDAEMNGHSIYSDLAVKAGVMNLREWIEARGNWAMSLSELQAALEVDVAEVEDCDVNEAYEWFNTRLQLLIKAIHAPDVHGANLKKPEGET